MKFWQRQVRFESLPGNALQQNTEPQFEPVPDMLLPDPAWKMPDLQTRIKVFLDSPLPPEIDYAADNITENYMLCYLDGDTFDAEMTELLNICAFESENSETSMSTPEAKAFFRESGNIIKGIIWELQKAE